MSKHQSFMPDDRAKTSKSGRKRKGKFELWMRRNPKAPMSWFNEWHRVRKYETLEMAEKNRDDNIRKWGKNWEFEVRISDD